MNRFFVNPYLIFFSLIFCQIDLNPRMLGVSGASTTIASGYNSIGVNPANLATNKSLSMNLFSIDGFIVNDHSITYSSGCLNSDASSFYVSDGLGDVTITLNMELNKWYSNPNITLTTDGIMGNEQMQISLKNNGNCIFSNSVFYE